MEGPTTIWRRRPAILALLMVAACSETYIDLTPDGGGSDGMGDVPGDGPVMMPPPPCGNRVIDPGEECDDGNRLDGDGCTWGCRVGSGDPVGPPDPGALAYRAEPAQRSGAVEAPPLIGPTDPLVLAAVEDLLAVAWYRSLELPDVDGAVISARFLAADGAPAREDVAIRVGTGWRAWHLTGASVEDALLLAWRMDGGGIWRAGLTRSDGLAEPPFPLVGVANADVPALAAGPDGYYLAWYEGDDTRYCVHDGSGPSTMRLRRLAADGSIDGMPPSIALEDELAARTMPDVAPGADGSVGVLWWRAATDAGGSCSLRFGVADEALTTFKDGGTLGHGYGGRLVEAEGAFRVVWHDVRGPADTRLGIASFDRDGALLRAPVVTVLAATSLAGDVEAAAGDGGLTLVARLYEASSGLRLRFARTDLFGRMVGGFEEVDPTCTAAARCVPGAFNVARVPGGFVVLYFVEADTMGPEPVVELRMVRLVPAP